VADLADHLAAALLDDNGGRRAAAPCPDVVVGVTKNQVVLARFTIAVPANVGEAHRCRSECPVLGATGNSCDVGVAAALIDVDLVLLFGQGFRDRQRDGGGGPVEDRVDLLVVVPVAGDADADVGLVSGGRAATPRPACPFTLPPYRRPALAPRRRAFAGRVPGIEALCRVTRTSSRRRRRWPCAWGGSAEAATCQAFANAFANDFIISSSLASVEPSI